MPIYEYRCSQGHQYERWEGFDAPVEQECPDCGSTARRLFSPPAIIFKGPGFYSTDNRKNGHRSEEESESREEAKAESTTP
ncbi:MAG TPA: FmdB family zinc ribbon protein [Dehalococcoidia bacterium]|nr:FmdB family zinc ribbon protein [Dehalococcoidia bacterium]